MLVPEEINAGLIILWGASVGVSGIFCLVSVINAFLSWNALEISNGQLRTPDAGFKEEMINGYCYRWGHHIIRVFSRLDNIEKAWRVTDPDEILKIASFCNRHTRQYSRFGRTYGYLKVRDKVVISKSQQDAEACQQLVIDAFHSAMVNNLHSVVAIQFKRLSFHSAFHFVAHPLKLPELSDMVC